MYQRDYRPVYVAQWLDAKTAAFVKKFSADDKSMPAGDSSRPIQTRPQPTHPISSQARFDPGLLTKAETELAKYIGAVARAVVRRAAAKARDETELYSLLAEEIDDPTEKKLFFRKAMSVSGRE